MTHPIRVPANVIFVGTRCFSSDFCHAIRCKPYGHRKLILELLVESTVNQATYDRVDHGFALITRWWVILEVPTEFCACSVVPHPKALRGNERDRPRLSVGIAAFHISYQRMKLRFRQSPNPKCCKRRSHGRSISLHAFSRITTAITGWWE